MNIRESLTNGARVLRDASAYSARDAAQLLQHSLGCDRTWLFTHPNNSLTPEQLTHYQALLARRAQHEPIQYILGEQEFYGLRFRVTPAVLIPRPETEHLVEAVLSLTPRERAVSLADVGTGSGAIAVALAHALPLAHIDALDISADALAVAAENAAAHGVQARVRTLRSDLLSAVAHQQFDIIVSNPPYIAGDERLEPQVADWEPHTALFAGPSGLEIYTRLIPEAALALRPGGLLALELGAGQAAAVHDIFRAHGGWDAVRFTPDLQGIQRVALAQRAP